MSIISKIKFLGRAKRMLKELRSPTTSEFWLVFGNAVAQGVLYFLPAAYAYLDPLAEKILGMPLPLAMGTLMAVGFGRMTSKFVKPMEAVPAGPAMVEKK